MKQIRLCLTVILVFCGLCGRVEGRTLESTVPHATNGVLDLRHWDFKKNGPIKLDGEWEFYWKTFLVSDAPKAENSTPSLIHVPGYWNDLKIMDDKLGRVGYGTYRLTVLMPPQSDPMALQLFTIGTAFSLFVNGEKTTSAGTIGKSESSSQPEYKPQICMVKTTHCRELIICIEVANYHQPYGGIWEPITLGFATDVWGLQEKRQFFEFLIFGAIFFMGIYHLSLYALKPKDLSPFYFSMACFVVSLRILCLDERYFLTLFPHVPWLVFHKIEFLTCSLTIATFFPFFRTIFWEEFNKKCNVIIVTIALIYSGIIIVTPPMWYVSFLLPFEIMIIVFCVYTLYVIALAIKNKRVGSIAFFLGCVVVFSSVINDILYQNQIIQSVYLAPFALFIMLLSQAFVISIRFSRAFESIEILEGKYRSIFENAIEGIYQQTLKGEFINANPSLAKILGYKDLAELKNSIHDVLDDIVVNPETRDEIKNRLNINGELLDYEVLIYKKDRQKIWVLANVKIIHDTETGSKHFEGMIIDITDRKLSEEAIKKAKDAAEASNNAKSQFIANMSHELRTPLNGVIGMTDLIMGTPLDKDQKDYIQIIHSSSSLLLTIVNDILDISKMESGQLYIEQLSFNLNEVMRDVHSILYKRASEKHIEFTYHIDQDIPLAVMGDSVRLTQILLNIAGNAIKFTETGSVTINLALENKQNECETVHFTIRDSGIGIDENNMDQLFKYFSQTDVSMSRKYGGTGLGLAISKNLVELMGGKIGVRSVLGVGSEFWFTLPFARQNKNKHEIPIHDEQPVAQSFTETPKESCRILIVEDNAVNRKLAETLLKKLGYTSDSVTDGSEAIAVLREKTYDLILMDIQMPIMDGFETTRFIRDPASDVKIHDVPIVAMTAHAMKGDMDKCFEAGMDAYMTKPIKPKNLEETISQQLRLKEEPVGCRKKS